MYVIRTVRKHVPIFQSDNEDDVLEIYQTRVDRYGKGKHEIFDCVKGEVVDAEDIKKGRSSGSDSGVQESVSEDPDISLYAAIGDDSESTTDSPY